MQVPAQRLELDGPQCEQGGRGDLRFGVVRTHLSASGQDLGGYGDLLVGHVALICPQGRGGSDQHAEAKENGLGLGPVVLRRQPGREARQLAGQDLQHCLDR